MTDIDLRPYVCAVTDFGVINHFEPGQYMRGGMLQGQGFFVSPRHVLTAAHCVHDLSRWTATNHEGASSHCCRGHNILYDNVEDVALVTLRTPIGPAPLPEVLAASHATLSPQGAFHAVAFFNDERGFETFEVTTRESDDPFTLSSTIPIQSGYSGAAILDSQGHPVGVVSGIPRERSASSEFKAASQTSIQEFMARAGLSPRLKREKPPLLERLSRLILK